MSPRWSLKHMLHWRPSGHLWQNRIHAFVHFCKVISVRSLCTCVSKWGHTVWIFKRSLYFHLPRKNYQPITWNSWISKLILTSSFFTEDTNVSRQNPHTIKISTSSNYPVSFKVCRGLTECVERPKGQNIKITFLFCFCCESWLIAQLWKFTKTQPTRPAKI